MARIFLLCFFCFILVTKLNAQEKPSIEQVISDLAVYNSNYSKEKVYLHFDRSHYSPGDDIWFKAYVTVGNLNLLSQHSKLINVELLDPSGDLVQSLRLPLSAGIAFADFSLGDSLISGTYQIRAYTQWMRNFDNDYFFEKEITIIDLLPSDSLSETKTNIQKSSLKNLKKKKVSSQEGKSLDSDSFKIEVFPESGQYSFGAVTKTALKITNSYNEGVRTSGWLKDTSGQNLMEVTTNEDGIGSFSFYPQKGEYSLLLMGEDGNEQSFNFSVFNEDGYTLAINNSSDHTLFVQVRLDRERKMDQELSLLIQQEGEVFYALKMKINNLEKTLNIPKETLGVGINEIVLLSEDMKPLTSRKFFHSIPERLLPMQIKLDKEQYSTREKVIVNLHSGLDTDSFRIATFSTAVTHDGKVPRSSVNETNIQSYILLQAGMKAKAKSPNSYFLNPEKGQIDELMLTLNRDDLWDNFNEVEIKFPAEKSMKLSGYVTRLNEKKAEPFAKVILFSASSGLLIDTLADENGRFVFDDLFFYDSTKFVLQARGEKGRKHLIIHLDSVDHVEVKKNKNNIELTTRLNKDDEFYIEHNKDRISELFRTGSLNRGIVLSEVEVKVKPNIAPNSSNLNGPGNADQVITEESLQTCPSLIVCLQGRLRGVVFRSGVPYSTRSMDIPMGIIVDGMRMEGEDLAMINSADVETVEVLRTVGHLTLYGSFGNGGIIIITTKRGDGISTSSYTPGLVTYMPKGFYQVREFNSPDYSSDDQPYIERDLRSTIYWKPNLVTDEEGKTSFEFYTSDQPGKYRIVVEGIDIQGRLAFSEVEFEVK